MEIYIIKFNTGVENCYMQSEIVSFKNELQAVAYRDSFNEALKKANLHSCLRNHLMFGPSGKIEYDGKTYNVSDGADVSYSCLELRD